MILYGSYLSGIIAFWFLKPFPPPQNDQAARARFMIALVCTAIFNLIILYSVSQIHLWGGGTTTVLDNVSSAVNWQDC
jgi:hypothetical protein